MDKGAPHSAVDDEMRRVWEATRDGLAVMAFAAENGLWVPWQAAFEAAMREHVQARSEGRKARALPAVRLAGPVPGNQFIMMLGAFEKLEVVS